AHHEAARLEADLQRLAHRCVVVDDEDAGLAHAESACATCVPCAGGRWIAISVPRPCSLRTSIHPPASCTMPSAIASPRPVPSPGPLVVKNGSKTCGRSSTAM